MNIKKNFVFLMLGLLMTFLLPNYVQALGFAPIDTQGKLLYFGGRPAPYATPSVVNCPAGAICSADGSGAVSGGANVVNTKYKYTNVITTPNSNGVMTQVDAYVTVESIDSTATITMFDNTTPNPGGGTSYSTNAGSGISSQLIPEAAVFAPQITVKGSGNSRATGGVTFLIEFKDTAGNPVVLQNVYNNSLDIEDVEYSEYGGFSSYELSNINPIPSGGGANCSAPGGTAGVKALQGTGTNIKFKGNVTACVGLYLAEFTRVQTKFDTISSLRIKMGQESGNGVRFYGAIFVHDEFVSSSGTTKTTAPTVNLLTTSDTTPTVTGTIGGIVSTTANGSAIGTLGTTDNFTIKIDSNTYTPTITGLTWTVNVPTVLSIGNHEVTATRNNVLVDQTNNELVITLSCTSPQVLNATGTLCVVPTPSDSIWCHSGDGVSYSKSILSATDYTHITHTFDEPAVAGKCPDEVVTCDFAVSGTVLNSAGTACVIPSSPTATSANTTEGTATNITGSIGTSTTIASVSLTKLTDGLGATVSNATPTIIGTNVSVTNNVWSVSSGTNVAVGTYRISVTDGYGKTANATLTVTCPAGKVSNSTGSACITATAPTVTSTSTTEGIATTISGGSTTSSTISSVTLTKISDGLGVSAIGATASTIGTNLTVTNNVWSVSSGTPVIGTYTITVTDGNNLTATGTLTVSCPSNKIATSTQCVTLIRPTVSNATTTDLVPVTISGTYPILNVPLISGLSVTLTNQTSGVVTTLGAVTPVGGILGLILPTSWTVSSGAMPVGTYTITATSSVLNGIDLITSSGTGTLTVTCANSKVVNFAGNACISAPTVTASQTFSTLTPVITGTVGSSDTMGSPALGATESFSVNVNNVTYTYRTDSALSVTGTSWRLTLPTPLTAGQSYLVTATRDGSLTGTGTIVINGAPSVDAHPDTFDGTPTITGRIGTGALVEGDTFSVKINNVTYSYRAGVTTVGNVIVNADLTWSLTLPEANKLSAGTYPIEALRNTLLGTGSVVIKPCALPSVVNETADTCTIPVPTVTQAGWNSNTVAARQITGTIGNVALGSNETFSVTIGTTTPLVYNKSDAALSIVGTNWTLTIPTGTLIPAGTYSVEAARNVSAKNTDAAGKLVIQLVCDVGSVAQNGTCVSQASLPTVNSGSTDDTTPVITGTVGMSALNGDAFGVTVDGVPYNNGDGNLIVTGTVWQLTIPIGNALATGSHSVVATRNTLEGTGVITVTRCTRKLNAAGDCVDFSLVPTVDASATHTMSETRIVVSGTVGDNALTNSDTFNVTVTEHGNPTNALTGVLVVNGTTWTFRIDSLKSGTFDVNAVRNGVADTTNSELQIGIQVCELPAKIDKTVSLAEFNADAGNHYVFGSCNSATTQNLPSETFDNFVPEEPSTGSECVDAEGGGARTIPSDNITNATIKRAKIINATSKNGTTRTTFLTGKNLRYGVKESGTMSIANSANITGNVATGVTLENVTLSDVYVQIDSTAFDAGSTGIPGLGFRPDDSVSIEVSGGTTDPSSNDKTRITDGVITSGSVGEIPIRGRIVKGFHNVSTTTMKTLGRRVKINTLTGVKIENATTTTVRMPDNSLKTVIENGMITSFNATATASTIDVSETFGTAINARIENATISDSNSCFSSGTVGARGQLNWKEVISE